MQAANIPAKFGVAWAANAATTGGPNGDGYKRTPPAASQIGVHDGYASFADGFPPLTAQPVASGGVPPYIEDFNGALGMVTAWDQWVQAGGPVSYDSAFASGMGGYPAGALLISTSNAGITWQNTADGNTSNPDGSSPSGWVARPVTTSALEVLAANTTGTGGAIALQGSGSNGTAIIQNATNALRIYTGTGGTGFLYSLPDYTLTIGYGGTGTIYSNRFISRPDGSGNRLYYFSDSNDTATGYIKQDNTGGSTSQAGVTTGNGNITINAGGNNSVTIDTSGGVAASSFNANGGNVTNFNLAQSTAVGGASFGAAGVVSLGPVSVTGEIDLYGKGIKFVSGAYGTGGGLTAQLIYNDTSTNRLSPNAGAETQVWCVNATMSIDSNGNGYLRGPTGTANAKGASINVTVASERALKQDIAPLTGGMAALMNAPPVRFRYNAASGLDTTVEHVGHIYEELAEAMPEATLRVGERGQVDQRYIVPYLHSALLEVAGRMTAMQARLDALDALERRLAERP